MSESDDSGSMNQDNRIKLQADVGERITSLTTRLVPEDTGIELRFINAPNEPRMSKPRSKVVNEILLNIPYSGPTEIGTNCKAKILEEVVYRPIKVGRFERPVLVSIITDGCPGGPAGSNEKRDTLKEVIVECGHFLEANGYKKNGEPNYLVHRRLKQLMPSNMTLSSRSFSYQPDWI